MGIELLAALKIASMLGLGLGSSTIMKWFNTYEKKTNKKEEVGNDEIKSLIQKSKSIN